MSESIDEYTITLGDLLQAFACSMCRYGGDEPCKYLPESNKKLCEHFKRKEQEHE